MSYPKNASDLIKPSDRHLTLVAIGIALSCLIPVVIPGLHGPINDIVRQAIPWKVGALLLLTSVAIYYAILVNQLVRYNDHMKERQRQEERDSLGHFAAQVGFHREGEGTVWHITNTSRFPWTNGHILVEREIDGRKQFEKHTLGRVGIRKTVMVQSRMAPAPMAFWRVMVVSDQGRKVDFPEETGAEEVA